MHTAIRLWQYFIDSVINCSSKIGSTSLLHNWLFNFNSLTPLPRSSDMLALVKWRRLIKLRLGDVYYCCYFRHWTLRKTSTVRRQQELSDTLQVVRIVDLYIVHVRIGSPLNFPPTTAFRAKKNSLEKPPVSMPDSQTNVTTRMVRSLSSSRTLSLSKTSSMNASEVRSTVHSCVEFTVDVAQSSSHQFLYIIIERIVAGHVLLRPLHSLILFSENKSYK